MPNRFENMGAQVVREVSKQTNEVAGDGTTTATVLANALIQDGLEGPNADTSPVDLVAGIDLALARLPRRCARSARPLAGHDPKTWKRSRPSPPPIPRLGRLVAEA